MVNVSALLRMPRNANLCIDYLKNKDSKFNAGLYIVTIPNLITQEIDPHDQPQLQNW